MEDSEILNAFLEEAHGVLEACEQNFLSLEKFPNDQELINSCFRGLHTVKGSSGFFEFNNIGLLAHAMEDALGHLRDHKLPITPSMIDAQLKGIDQLKILLEDVTESDRVDISELIENVRNSIHEKKDENLIEGVPKEQEKLDEENLIRYNILSKNANEIAQVEAMLKNMGEVVSKAQKDEGMEYQFDTVLEPHLLKTCDIGDVEISTLIELPEKVVDEVRPSVKPIEDSKQQVEKSSKQKLVSKELSVRVPFNLLNSLIELAGEIILSRNQFISKIDGELLEDFKNMSQQITDLQEGIMKTRMQPLSTVTVSFPRIVRDLSRKLNKDVSIEIKGDEIELDKSVLEGLGGPFTHIIRNCMDHGIEDPQSRILKGKSQQGKIKIEAQHRGGFVVIAIKDDGKGIDPEVIKSIAIKKNVLTEVDAQALSDREAIELIWAPGFSSAEEVSEVSGRGVGMDVVRNEILELNGFVEIDSQVDVGTIITLTLPLSTAIIQSLLLKYKNSIYAIPRNSIQEVLNINTYEQLVEKVNDVEMIRYRNQLFPVVKLADVLGEKRTYFSEGEMREDRRESLAERRQVVTETSEHTEEIERDNKKDRRKSELITVLMIKVNRSLYGLIVDESLAQEETVVKPINEVVRNRYQHFMGTTILSNGSVSFIIDPLGIANKAKLKFTNNNFELKHQQAKTNNVELDHYLVFRGGHQDRLAILTNLVEFIYTVQANDLLEVSNQKFISINQKDYQLIFLDQWMKLNTIEKDEDGAYSLIIPKYLSTNIAIVASTIEGIERIPSGHSYVMKHEKGIIGSIVWKEQLLTMLDIHGLDDMISGHSMVTQNDQKKILLLEDSPVFQRIVKDHLQSFGLSVTLAEDGEIGLSKLQLDKYDLIVSDIEMPNMNGYEFCQRVREMHEFSSIPIIAMTSLDDEESRATAFQSGFSEYLVKVNRIEFYNTLGKYIKLRST